MGFLYKQSDRNNPPHMLFYLLIFQLNRNAYKQFDRNNLPHMLFYLLIFQLNQNAYKQFDRNNPPRMLYRLKWKKEKNKQEKK
jgi:hypothetical protein